MDSIDDLEHAGPFTQWLYQIYSQGSNREDDLPRLRLLAYLQDTFECKRCGRCCIEQDVVECSMRDVRVISKRFGMSSKEFVEKYAMKRVAYKGLGQFYQMSWDKGKTCPFYDGSGCTIYEDRPDVCRRFPFLTPEGIIKTVQMENGIWYYGARCKSSVEHADRILATVGMPKSEPNEETKRAQLNQKG